MRANTVRADAVVVNFSLVQKRYDFYSTDTVDPRNCTISGQSGLCDIGVADCMVADGDSVLEG